jgi:diguanylate cyclase (GGDEF)-like protein
MGWGDARHRLAAFLRQNLQCSDQLGQELDARHAGQLLRLLPVLGPLFSLAILMFSAWDFWRDTDTALAALALRISLVGVGALAYLPLSANLPALYRGGILFVTHSSAIVLAEYVLIDGFVYGLAGVTSCLFVASALTMRARAFLAMVLVPTLLLLLLGAQRMAFADFVNAVMLYVFALVLALTLMLVIRSFALQTMELEGQLLRSARRDSLSGAYNRGYLFELAEGAVALAQRHGRSLAVAMLDIDHFKHVNDEFGHAAGDCVIASLANICLAELRTVDHFGRIGGEEFVCVMPETDEIEAVQCAERLRSRIEAAIVETPTGPVRFTVSIGVAMLGPACNGWTTLLHAADCALYRAKHAGRNRVVMA